MTVRGRRGLLVRIDRNLLIAGGVSALAVLGLLLPWIKADPPAGLTFSNSPYTDEGLFNSAARDLVMFGSFGHAGLFRQLTNPAYVLANSVVFAVAGPSLAAARVLSTLSVCAMVVILLCGLTRLVGFPAALVAAAGVAGSPLMLLYGHLALVEPFETLMLVAGFVCLARGMAGSRWVIGAIGGLFLAAAVGSKESAVLALPGILGVPLVASLATRSWRRLIVVLSAAGALLLTVGIWALAVALPNRADLHAATRTFGYTSSSAYPHTVGGILHRLGRWLSHPPLTDHVITWSVPLLVAAGAGLVVGALMWRRVRPAHLYVTASGLIWLAGCWAVPVLSGYSPNRYLVVAVPGLALTAGPGLGLGLEWVGEHIQGRWWTLAGSVAMAVAVFVPGVLTYVRAERRVLGTDQLGADQAAVARVLPANAVLFGVYAPEMVFSHRVRTVIPWPQSGLHMDSPVANYGVTDVIADVSGRAGPEDRAVLKDLFPAGRPPRPPLVTVAWGPHRLAVYQVGPPGPAPGHT